MIGLLSLCLLPLVLGQPSCLFDGILGPSNDKCYHFITSQQNLDDAQVICGAFNARPVSIKSGFESNFILSIVHERFSAIDYWIGLTDLYNENEWRWMDSSVTNYSNWATGFPKNDSSLRCVLAQFSSGKWYNVNCTSRLQNFVCESDPPQYVAQCYYPSVNAPNGCLTMVGMAESYTNAQILCAEFGLSLVEILNSEEEQNLFTQTRLALHGLDYWIGLSDPLNSGVFQNYDGSPANFTYWGTGQPTQDASKLCVAAKISDSKWYNENCDNKLFFVCESREKGSLNTTTTTTTPSTPSLPQCQRDSSHAAAKAARIAVQNPINLEAGDYGVESVTGVQTCGSNEGCSKSVRSFVPGLTETDVSKYATGSYLRYSCQDDLCLCNDAGTCWEARPYSGAGAREIRLIPFCDASKCAFKAAIMGAEQSMYAVYPKCTSGCPKNYTLAMQAPSGVRLPLDISENIYPTVNVVWCCSPGFTTPVTDDCRGALD